MHTDSVVNAAFEVQIDEWRGRRSVKAMLRTLAPARACGALDSLPQPREPQLRGRPVRHQRRRPVRRQPQTARRHRTPTRRLRETEPQPRWEAQGPGEPATDLEHGRRARHHRRRRRCTPRSAPILDRLRGRPARRWPSWPRVAASRSPSRCTLPCRALLAHEASLFVYPLRALIADQAFHLNEALAPFGIVTVPCSRAKARPTNAAQVFDGLAERRGGHRAHHAGVPGATTPTSWLRAGASGSSWWTRRTTSAWRRPASGWPTPRYGMAIAQGWERAGGAGADGHGAPTQVAHDIDARAAGGRPRASTRRARDNLYVDDQRNLQEPRRLPGQPGGERAKRRSST